MNKYVVKNKDLIGKKGKFMHDIVNPDMKATYQEKKYSKEQADLYKDHYGIKEKGFREMYSEGIYGKNKKHAKFLRKRAKDLEINVTNRDYYNSLEHKKEKESRKKEKEIHTSSQYALEADEKKLFEMTHRGRHRAQGGNAPTSIHAGGREIKRRGAAPKAGYEAPHATQSKSRYDIHRRGRNMGESHMRKESAHQSPVSRLAGGFRRTPSVANRALHLRH